MIPSFSILILIIAMVLASLIGITFFTITVLKKRWVIAAVLGLAVVVNTNNASVIVIEEVYEKTISSPLVYGLFYLPVFICAGLTFLVFRR